MNKKIIFLAIALAVAISAAAFVFNKKSEQGASNEPLSPPPPASTDTETTSPKMPLSSAAVTTTGGIAPSMNNGQPAAPSMAVNEEAGKEVSKWASTPLSKEEKQSVKVMATTLVKYLDPKLGNPDTLVKDMTKAGLQPVMAKDFNQYTGKMIVVRCNNPPPGTRCCHAQYFEDENKKPFLQHMSFELRPNPEGMQAAAAALDAALQGDGKGRLGKAKTQTEDMAHWELKDNYSATIMKLNSAEDLKYDPFCAHDPVEDKGSFKVMVEMVPDKDE